MSETYTHGHHESVLRSHEWRTAENSAGYLLDRLEPGMDLLDVGCGPGTITIDLAARVAPGSVVGIDRSDEVIAQAGALARSRGVENVTFATGDVYALDFPDASFDVVHAHQVLQHLREPVDALRELRRVLRPGGTLAVRDSDYAAFVWAPTDAAPGAMERAVPRSDRAQRRRGRCGTPPARLGAGGRLHGGAGRQLDVDVRRSGRSRVVGEHVGGPVPALGLRGAGGRVRAERPRRSLRPSKRLGGTGASSPTASSRCSTARSWLSHDPAAAQDRVSSPSSTCSTTSTNPSSPRRPRPSRRARCRRSSRGRRPSRHRPRCPARRCRSEARRR